MNASNKYEVNPMSSLPRNEWNNLINQSEWIIIKSKSLQGSLAINASAKFEVNSST